jgi:hypothetical protein
VEHAEEIRLSISDQAVRELAEGCVLCTLTYQVHHTYTSITTIQRDNQLVEFLVAGARIGRGCTLTWRNLQLYLPT